MTMSGLARSLLFVPGNRPDRFDKALASGAHSVILDLEDSVPAAEKSQARNAVSNWLCLNRNVLIRVNAMQTPWFRDDVAMALVPGVAGIVLPKAEHLDGMLGEACTTAGKVILPMIESALGLSHAALIASSTGVQRLIFGSLDFRQDLDIEGDDLELLAYRSQLVLTSRLAGLAAPVDGVTVEIDDAESLRERTLRCRGQGFGGKLCIHPKQVGIVNSAFAHSPQELHWARRVLEAAERCGGGAVAVDGQMVDRPAILRAEAIIARAAKPT
jgi:citrate lyase subunit beta / citryl-CoA lyase